MKIQVATVLLSETHPSFSSMSPAAAPGIPEDILRRSGEELTWPEREPITLEVSPSDTYDAILERACEAMSLLKDYSWPRILFPDHNGQFEDADYRVNADGTLCWWFDIRWHTPDSLHFAVRKKVTDVDPNRLVLVINEQYNEGGNGHDAWLDVYRAITVLWPYILGAGALISTGQTYRDIIKGGARAIRGIRTREWASHVQIPQLRSLMRIPKTTSEAAVLLNLDEPTTHDFLLFAGLINIHGYWHLNANADDQELVEWGDVLAVVAEGAPGGAALRAALSEVLSLPVGKRAAAAPGILRSAILVQSETEYLLGFSSPRTIDVLSGDRLTHIGQILLTDEMETRAVLSDGSQLRDLSGRPLSFLDIDAAASALVEHRRQGSDAVLGTNDR